MQHSPEPWRFDGDWQRLPTILDSNGRSIAFIEKSGIKQNGRYDPMPDEIANAYLMTAAPTMLAA